MELIEQMTIPTIIPIGKNFSPGKGIKLRCMVPTDSTRFTIDLFCGQDVKVQTDSALHIFFNFSNNNTVLNSKQKGSWGTEHVLPGIPFNYVENFEILVMCDQYHYKIFINGRPYYDFPQIVNSNLITFLAINGNVIIEQILFENFQVFIPCTIIGKVPCMSQDSTAPLNPNECNWRPVQQSKKKLYAIYVGVALIVIICFLCAVFIPRVSGKHEYDFD